ncbi:MAG TPA: DUF5982 domain-containing protein [Leptospiraceae bacterium]|nr:DUF5982 domain-containing protein [Leptospiraceae bacterium]HMW04545.1 DUF5982 domain-containing protein [Leptospiraceae bacterium]HMX33460.1 DUF5982 domain-containing protein [Leptospiraceae bacterium]HMY30731.1 DUF5982 domain-containing protein [Leptospiraceae bacterium]HMZ64309.1 DUF5982 domain-containing protein [Leptospiraceae bacterium]
MLKVILSLSLFLIFFLSKLDSEDLETDSSLPFPIDKSRRIDSEELKYKRENSFITGLPSVSSDPITGVWYGGSGYFTQNGKKNNPLFAYAPYVYRVTADIYQSSVGARFYGAGVDLPYFQNTPFRISLYGFYDRNLRSQYYGVGESTLHPLSYHPRNDDSQPLVTNAEYSQREEAISFRRPGRVLNGPTYVTDQKYNEFDAENSGFFVNIDRTFWKVFRFAVGADGYRMIVRPCDGQIVKAKDPFWGETDFSNLNVVLPTPNAKTKLTEDNESNKIIGYDGGYTNLMKAGIAYDSRDFEPNPKKGVFAEVNLVKASRAWGSNFDFQREFLQIKIFYSILPKIFSELVFASRVALTNVTGNIPFYEYRHMWSIDGGPIYGLGGGKTMKGYKQDRFIGNTMGFANTELRYRFAKYNIGDEYFTFQIVPSVDLGRVWNSIDRLNWQGYKYSYGLGLKIIWNQSTVLSFDYSVSREDKQFFMNFGHTF